jgi:flavin reductase (DIM6/NTAB) family NADH-FMN oxidoreductase RutF
MNDKVQIEPNTTLYPVPVVIITCGAPGDYNIFSLNRIASCNAEPPMISISVRPIRRSHDLIDQTGEFVVNIPWPDMETVSDFVGTTTGRDTDKWRESGLTPLPAEIVQPPLIAECPVNIECRVVEKLTLPSHTLFVAQVLALHAEKEILDRHGEVDYELAGAGLPYRAGTVREKPVARFKPDELLRKMHNWRDARKAL